MSDPQPSLEYVMNATMEPITIDVSYAMDLEYLMPITAGNAHSNKKIEMDVLKLLILEL